MADHKKTIMAKKKMSIQREEIYRFSCVRFVLQNKVAEEWGKKKEEKQSKMTIKMVGEILICRIEE